MRWVGAIPAAARRSSEKARIDAHMEYRMTSAFPPYEELAHIPYSLVQQSSFRSGSLLETWAAAYPFLFDAQDVAAARNQALRGYHFVEWLSAIHLWQEHGWLSLQSKYPYKKHAGKRAIFADVAGAATSTYFAGLTPKEYFQAPDLFVYAPDRSIWFYCEVKGPRDRLRPKQSAFFDALVAATGASIKVITLSEQGPRPA